MFAFRLYALQSFTYDTQMKTQLNIGKIIGFVVILISEEYSLHSLYPYTSLQIGYVSDIIINFHLI